MNFAHMQRMLTFGLRNACQQDRTMLISVTRKKMSAYEVKIFPRDPETAFFHHCSFSRKSSTFKIFAGAFCKPFCAALFRLDI